MLYEMEPKGDFLCEDTGTLATAPSFWFLAPGRWKLLSYATNIIYYILLQQ